MKNIKGFIACCVVFFSVTAQAELYKFVDEKGRVTYTDQKPEDIENVIPIDEATIPVKKRRFAYSPIERPFDKTVHWLMLLRPEFQWQDDLDTHRQIGVYHFGKNCGYPTSMLWPDINFQHKNLLASSSKMGYDLRSAINKMGYKVALANENNFRRQLESFDGLILEAEIISLDFQACAAKTTRTYKDQPLKNFRPASFKNNHVSISVNWRLFSSYGEKPVFELKTRGYSDGRKQQYSGSAVMMDALLNAMEGLFSEQAFIDQLMDKTLPIIKESVVEQPLSITDQFLYWLEKKWLGNVVEKQMLVAGVMNDLSYIKMMIFPAIAEYGGVTDDVMADIHQWSWSKGVSDVDVSQDGVINMVLSESIGENIYLSLFPGDYPEHFSEWRCETNIPKQLLPVGMQCL